jgi:hypothetical protein
MSVQFETRTALAVTIDRADGRGTEPGFELARKGSLVKVEYLYSPFTGWVRSERVREGRDN